MIERFVILFIFLFGFIGCQESDETAEDIFGIKTSSEVNINLMSINPSNKTLYKGESVQLRASGGTPPYTYSIDSGIGSVDEFGFYTAPDLTGNSVVKAVDAEGKIAYATINIAIQISISPSNATIGEGDTLQFSGSGGVPIYTYRLVAGDGIINSSTGLYDATGVSSGSAVIEVKDSVSNTAYSSISINPSLILNPTIQTIGYGQQINFTTSGGATPYTYSLLSGLGAIDASTGAFLSGNANGTSIIRVTDNAANTVDAVITVVDSPQINSPQSKVAISRSLTFTSSNGSPPYTYSIVSGGGSIIAATGVFTAPASIDTTVIKVTDVNNYSDSVSINTFIPKKIAAGLYHTCLTDYSTETKTTSKCWGRVGESTLQGSSIGPYSSFYFGDDLSELGDNLVTTDFGPGVDIIGAKVGRYSGCAITSDYRLKCWGYNGLGQLGVGTGTSIGYANDTLGANLVFTELGSGLKINSTLPIDDVLVINHHSVCAILDNDELKCWGYNLRGKLGLGITGGANDVIGNASTEINDNLNPVNLGADKAIQVGIGEYHTCVLLNNNKVKCWGEGGDGRTGLENPQDTGEAPARTPDNLSYVDLGAGRTSTKICVGYRHSCAILDTGDVKCWGVNGNGQLGLGHTTNLGYQVGDMGDNLLAVDLGTGKTATDLSCGAYFTCATLNTGEVACWGRNNYGQLGNGTSDQIGDAASEMGDALLKVNLGTSRTASKLFQGFSQTCAKLDNGDFKCWGRNDAGQLAQGHLYNIGKSALSMGDNLDPINLSSTETISSISVSEYSGCATLSDNSLKCFGGDFWGSRSSQKSIIGDASSEMGANLLPLDVGSNADFKEIKSRRQVTCGLNFDNKLTCWSRGDNAARGSGNGFSIGGAAGDWGDNLKFIDFGSGRTVKDFDVGYISSCALLSDDTVSCWGYNAFGQLGVGSTAARGDHISEVGDGFLTTDLGTVSTVVQVSAGHLFKCARFLNGKVKCWGRNAFGQLGKVEATYPVLGTSAAHMGDNLSFIDLGAGISSTQICTGAEYACSLFDNQKVKCWGRGAHGQLGQGSNVDLGDEAGELGASLDFIDLGTGRTAKKISCGYYHACAILDNDTLKCWGDNAYGQLGIGNTLRKGDAPSEMGDNLPVVKLGTNRFAVDIIAGYYHTCAVLDNNDLKCWGRNTDGQLGLEHLTNMGTLNVTMGDGLPKVETE